MSTDIPAETTIEPAGLEFWMACVTRECDGIHRGFAPGPVHDLRVALRRCRSIADGFMAFDPHPAWKLMKSESRKLFQQLGALRDTQVMLGWVQRLVPVQDEASFILHSYLEDQEAGYKEKAAEAVLEFNQKKWNSWARILSSRTRHIPTESVVFQHLALECLVEARELHRQAMRNRSQASYHRLRIALKKFRYTMENFLPSRHEKWGAELRDLQNILGEMHDLDVLWRTALTIKAFGNERTRIEWRRRISEESGARIEIYRAKMIGKTSLFLVWRSELPGPDQIQDAALARIRIWAAFRDPDGPHSERVAKIALQIYDGLEALGLSQCDELPEARRILRSAALAHAVGFHKTRKKSQVASYRRIRKINPPLGLNAATLRHIALVVRFHRGSLPHLEQKTWSGISNAQRKGLVLLSGILRLADAFDRLHGRRVYRLELKKAGEILLITAPGYVESDSSAEKLAAARHLLEIACRLPILIRN